MHKRHAQKRLLQLQKFCYQFAEFFLFFKFQINLVIYKISLKIQCDWLSWLFSGGIATWLPNKSPTPGHTLYLGLGRYQFPPVQPWAPASTPISLRSAWPTWTQTIFGWEFNSLNYQILTLIFILTKNGVVGGAEATVHSTGGAQE